MQTYLDNAASAVERFDQRIEDGLLAIARSLYHAFGQWMIRVKNHLARLGRALVHLLIALGKLILFYSPAVFGWISEWKVFAVLWLIAVTAIGLFHGSNRRIHSTDEAQPQLPRRHKDTKSNDLLVSSCLFLLAACEVLINLHTYS